MSVTALSLDLRDISFAFGEWLPINKIGNSKVWYHALTKWSDEAFDAAYGELGLI